MRTRSIQLFARMSLLLMSTALSISLSGCKTIPSAALKRHEFRRLELGMQFSMVLYSADPARARLAAKTAFDRVRALAYVLSDYEDDSELNRLRHTSGSGNWIPVSDELWTVLRRSSEMSQRTDGAFDITAGPLIQLWKRARRQRAFPDSVKLEEAKTRVGHYYVNFREKDRAVVLWRQGMRPDLGGIAKGYIMDEAMKTLQQEGIQSALISAGGDMVASDSPPGKIGWKIELPRLGAMEADPLEFIRLSNGAFATSGDRYQSVVLDGKRYSHIVDPRTGIGLTDRSLIYVIARDGMTADSLATAISVVGPSAGLDLATRYRAEVKIQRKPTERVITTQSAGFNSHLWAGEIEPK